MAVTIENPCVARLSDAIAQRRGCTARTGMLAEAAITGKVGVFSEQRRLVEECPASHAASQMLRDAEGFAWVYPRLTPVIADGELIVGGRLRDIEQGIGGCWYPEGHASYIDGFARNTPPDRPDLQAIAQRGLISPQGSLNHKVVDYAGFIRTGSQALAARARKLAGECEGEEREFCVAFALGHEAMIAHARTYAEACERLADATDPLRASELREIARICRTVPAHPAATFHEALQSFWFAYMVAGDATGRPDVSLRSFYEADVAAGRLTPDEAQELVECFLIKLHSDVFEGVLNVSSVQTMTLAGVLPDGSDASSELTRIFLRAIRSVRLLRPTVYLRLHDNSPSDLVDFAVEMLGEGLAEPSFYSDRPILEGLTRIGVPIEEARDYALSGCTEVVSPGLGNWGAPNGWINIALLADEALRTCAASGATGEAAVWDAVARHVEVVADACRDCNQWVDDALTDPRYNSTILMPVTLEARRDIAHGGARTNYGHWEAIGLPNAADMVAAALHPEAFGAASLRDLLARIDAGDSELQAALRGGPRFGNGDPVVDAVAARLVNLMADALEARSTTMRRALVLGHLAGGENMHIGYGSRMGATLDGRRPGETLADSLAGAQGAASAGPTALVHSLCALDHSRLIAGNVSTLMLTPAEFATPAARRKVAALIRTFVAMGGSQLQINVTDPATLRAAQDHPEEYRGLLVRVAGYSADFTSIGKLLQDEIIARYG